MYIIYDILKSNLDSNYINLCNFAGGGVVKVVNIYDIEDDVEDEDDARLYMGANVVCID